MGCRLSGRVVRMGEQIRDSYPATKEIVFDHTNMSIDGYANEAL